VDFEIDGHVGIITGASRGLGLAMVEALVAEGARVVATARDEEALQDLVAQHPDQVVALRRDMTDLGDPADLVRLATERFGRLDFLVNNAGIAPAGKFVDQDERVWEEVLQVNVLAPMRLARACGQHFLERGRGKVVNIASGAGMRGKPVLVAYSTSKGALVRFTEALAAEWAPHGIQVNAIAPGAFATDAQAAVLEDPAVLERRIRRIPARRIAEPSEIGALACYLVSPVSDFVNGSTFVIDGGEVAKL
jgi:2-deoxy-D-gluconate 3-dehydrogenase